MPDGPRQEDTGSLEVTPRGSGRSEETVGEARQAKDRRRVSTRVSQLAGRGAVLIRSRLRGQFPFLFF